MLDKRQHYLQIALNGTLTDARAIISELPSSPRLIYEAGTPFIKRYGEDGIRSLRSAIDAKLGFGFPVIPQAKNYGLIGLLADGIFAASRTNRPAPKAGVTSERPYLVADIKAIDRGQTEVEICARGGANAATVMGTAPVETLDAFIDQCAKHNLDAMVDMMNVEFPIEVLSKLRKRPKVVILHRGVDEEQVNHEKQIPFWAIQRIIGTYDVMIAIAGGDTAREVQRAAFNGAHIVVVWKDFYASTANTKTLAEAFLKDTK
ncbi:MAG: orotidine 5'-phosphate decarboxylase / HUMPS family protein [Patescibacteria group bacterium]